MSPKKPTNMITSFPYPQTDANPGGCSTFSFIPYQNVSQLAVNRESNTITSILLEPGFDFFEGYATKGTLRFEEKIKENDAGIHFLTTIRGFYPKLCPQPLAVFSSMTQQHFILKLTDNNLQKRVIGTHLTPLRFTFDQASGRNPADRNGFWFTFSAELLHQSPFLIE